MSALSCDAKGFRLIFGGGTFGCTDPGVFDDVECCKVCVV